MQGTAQGVAADVRAQAKAKSTAKALHDMEEKEEEHLRSAWQGGTEGAELPVPEFARNAGMLGTLLLFAGCLLYTSRCV